MAAIAAKVAKSVASHQLFRFAVALTATEPLTAGKHTLRYEFAYDGGGPGKGGTGRIVVDGAAVAQGRIEHTCGYIFASTDALDVGRDTGAQVIDHYSALGYRTPAEYAAVCRCTHTPAV